MQLENLQTNLKSDHVKKINVMLVNERERMLAIQHQSNQLLQQSYLLLSANLLMTNAMELNYQELYKSLDAPRAVTFSAENQIKYDYDVEKMILTPNGQMEDTDCDVVAMNDIVSRPVPSGPKARRALHTVTSTAPLDVTQVLERHEDGADCQPLNGGHNSTFAVNAKPTPVAYGKRPLMVNRVLKETQQNIHRDTVMITKGNITHRWRAFVAKIKHFSQFGILLHPFRVR